MTNETTGLIGIAGFESRKGQRFFSSPKSLDQLWSSPSLLFNGYPGLFPEVRWPGRDLTHSHPKAPRLKMSAVMHLLPPHAFIHWTGTTLPLPAHKLFE